MSTSDHRWTFDESTGELKDHSGAVVATLDGPHSDDKIKNAMLDHAAKLYSTDPEQALIVLGLIAAENIDRVQS